MPFCSNCGKEILPTDRFCPNCGQSLGSPAAVPAVSPPAPSGQQPSLLVRQDGQGRKRKSPEAAAIFNFFLPGVGYVYAGLGRDVGEAVFGVLVFLFYFIGFEVTFIAETLTSTAPSAPNSVSPYDALIFLVFLLPFAFAYDGYRRAKLTP